MSRNIKFVLNYIHFRIRKTDKSSFTAVVIVSINDGDFSVS
jgi:hypothetical protein